MILTLMSGILINKRVIPVCSVWNKKESNPGLKVAILAVFLVSAFSFVPVAQAAQKATAPAVLGVVHINTLTGDRFLKAVQAAAKNDSNVKVVSLPYTDATHGTELLYDTVVKNKQKVDIIIGPTESDVFIRALEKRSELEEKKVPIISSLVSADVPHVRSGWFFLTNVDLRRRAQTTYDFLNKYWVQSIAILYANTEFGRRAEQAFSKELSATQRENYLSLSYQLPVINARSQIRTILNQRPEAIGIFGEREDIEQTIEMLKNMNEGAIAYKPILFTVLDARSLKDTADGLYFVAVTDKDKQIPNSDIKSDDVTSLAYDTTKLILGELKRLKKDIHTPGGRIEFRDNFETMLQTSSAQAGSISGMSFSHYKNIAALKLFKIEHNRKDLATIIPIKLDGSIGLEKKLGFKLNLLRNRFGYIPWLNATLIMLVIVAMSIIDIKKWYVGNVFYLVISSRFYLLLLVNSTLVVGLYIYMGETGAIRYDSILAALILAFAPISLLRTNLFETSTGKAIGLGKLYDGFLQWINDRLMIAGHNFTRLYVDLIAYHNTVDGMRDYLNDIYSGQPNAERRIKLTTELSQLVNDSIPYVSRRKICARLLLRMKKWKELRSDGMAPEGKIPENTLGAIFHKLDVWWYRVLHSKDEALKYENEKYCNAKEVLEDPEVLIRMAARHCSKNDEAREKLHDLIKERLEQFTDTDRKNDLMNALQKDIKGVVGEQARLRREIGFLFIIRGYDANRLKTDLGMEGEIS